MRGTQTSSSRCPRGDVNGTPLNGPPVTVGLNGLNAAVGVGNGLLDRLHDRLRSLEELGLRAALEHAAIPYLDDVASLYQLDLLLADHLVRYVQTFRNLTLGQALIDEHMIDDGPVGLCLAIPA